MSAKVILAISIAAFAAILSVDGAEPFEAFIGRWEQSSSDNADAYLAAIEVDQIVR